MWRRIWVKALQMFCHDHFPRMLATKLSSASFVRRQRDGLAVGVAGLAADCGRSTGGRVRDLPGILLGNQEGDQLGVDPSLCKFRFLGCQLVKSGQAFHTLEGQFELPAEAIKREHIGSREDARRQGRQQQDVVRGLKTARIGRLTALFGVLDQGAFFRPPLPRRSCV